MSLNTVVMLVNTAFIFSIIFLERKKTSEMISWILLMAAFPIGGFVMYLLFGDTLGMRLEPQFRRKSSQDKLYQNELLHQNNQLLSGQLKFARSEFKKHQDIIAMHIRQSDSLFSEDNNVEMLIDAQEKYAAMYADIEKAESSIHVEYFIIKPDDTGKHFISTLAAKAREGVEVRLIYDALGAMKLRKRHFKELTDAGGEVCRFMPSMIMSLLRANYRQHRKIIVIDGVIGYTGGINIGDEYLGLNPKRTPWRDTHLRLTGSSVQMLQMKFIQDWQHIKAYTLGGPEEDFVSMKYFPAPMGDGNMGVQIVTSGPDAPQAEIRDGYIKMINAAESTLYIQTPYLIPDDSFITSLKIAAASGVDVKIMLPGVPDKWYVYKVSMSYAGDMLNNGISIFLHKGFLHSKMVVMDDEVSSIGTTNIDVRSFDLDFELNAFVYDKQFATQSRKQFEKDLQDCEELTIEKYRKRGFWEAFIECLLRPFAPLM